MNPSRRLDNVDLPAELSALCEQLRSGSQGLVDAPQWPSQQIALCRQAGVFRWFIPKEMGGLGWSEMELLDAYLALSQACLTTTFILTQWVAACRRIVGSPNQALRQRLLPQLASGEIFASVGISHLTTSRQHIQKPVLAARENSAGGFVLEGFTPWVTAAPAADLLIVGATLADHKQIIAAVPTRQAQVEPSPGESLVALSASCTGRVDFRSVQVDAADIVAGPVENVMQTNSGGGAGGLQTSTLAVGLAAAAAAFITQQAQRRPDLVPIAEKITADVGQLRGVLEALTLGAQTSIEAPELRRQANSLVLRSTQAALSAAKGAGFLATHPAGRWAREALFFLVWSCPQDVVTANLCELAKLDT